jgi:E3 ubiquitin-protein ligase RAD18
LAENELARKRDIDKGRVEAAAELQTDEGRSKYATSHKSDFERLKQEIMQRDKKTKEGGKGVGVDSAIEVD